MIINRNINPERDLYFLGAVLIEILEQSDENQIDYIDLFSLFNQKREITMNLYSLTLDWLFILGLVTKGDNGKIKKCF